MENKESFENSIFVRDDYTREDNPEPVTNNSPLCVNDFWALIDNTAFATSRLRELELDQVGLTLAQSVMLNVLHVSQRPVTLEEITKNGMRQRHSISTLINRMAKIGLVNKVKDPEEKIFRISISPEGEELRSRAGSDSFKMVFCILTPQGKKLLAAWLETLLDRTRYLLGKSQVPPFKRHLNKPAGEPWLFKNYESDAEINDTQLWVLLDQFGFAVSRLRELELARFGLTVPQTSILRAVVSHGGRMTLQELEEKRMRRYHTILVTVNRMIKPGLIVQEKSRQDKKYRIVITEEGRKLVGSLTNDSLELTFSVLSDKDKQQMAAIMEKLLERARRLLGVPHISPFLRYLTYGGTKPEE